MFLNVSENTKLQNTEEDTEKTVDVKEVEMKIQKEKDIQELEEKRKSYVREWDKDKSNFFYFLKSDLNLELTTFKVYKH